MPKLFLPGSPEWQETVTATAREEKQAQTRPASKLVMARGPLVFGQHPVIADARPRRNPNDLVGRMLMLNTALANKFQCGGFHLAYRKPCAIVTQESQQGPIRAALDKGLLIDITGQDVKKFGIKTKDGQVTGIKEAETGAKVFVGTDLTGNLYVVAPKDAEQLQAFTREIETTGTLRHIEYEEGDRDVSIVSPVTTQELPSPAQPRAIPAKKKKAHARTTSRSGHARR